MTNFIHKYIDRWSIGFLLVIIMSAAMLSETPITKLADTITWIITFLTNFGVVFIIIKIYTKHHPQGKPSSFSMIKLAIRNISFRRTDKSSNNIEKAEDELQATEEIVNDGHSQTDSTSETPAQAISKTDSDNEITSFLKQEAIKIVDTLSELKADVKLLDIELDSGIAIFYIVPCSGIQVNTIIGLKSELMMEIGEIIDVFLDLSKSAIGIKVLASVAISQINLVDQMNGPAFEHFIIALLKKSEYENVQATGGSGDQGVDILAEKEGVRYAIQCKRYSHALGNTPVQEVNAGRQHYGCHVGVVVTNNFFTVGARELANSCKVLLWDRNWVLKMLAANDCEFASLSRSGPDFSLDTIVSKASLLQGNAAPQNAQKDEQQLLHSAVKIICETQTASTTLLQRRLRVGYAKAARLIDQLEELGVIGPFEGIKPRSVYLTYEEAEAVLRSKHV